MKNLNVFSGENAVRDFLNPANHITPLVELNRDLNPFFKDNIHIFIKLQTFLPLMNIKSVPAYQMLSNKKNTSPNLVEASSGNTAFSLSVLSKFFGYRKMTAIVSKETGIGKIRMLQLMGADVIICNDSQKKSLPFSEQGIELAQQIGKKKNWDNLDQYGNADNPLGHYRNCGLQILKQTDNDIQVFCNCLGTAGTIYGTAKAIKEQTQAVCVGIVKKKNHHISGPRSKEQLKVSHFEWERYVDELLEEGSFQAYRQSLKMCRNGILVGPSSGLNLSGLLKFLHNRKQKGQLEQLRNEKGQINCVILGCDLPFPYLDEYFKYLPMSYFPQTKYAD